MFTIFLILGGVGTALYSFSVVLELLIEGHMRDLVRRRRMERNIEHMSGHVVVCGWGRVGREVARFLAAADPEVVVVDRDATRLEDIPYPWVSGDVTDDETLIQAGIERAETLVAALDTDADNLYVTLAARSMRPDMQIIARARNDSSEPKLLRAGANRVVNPQQLGGDRMAAFVTQPHVVDFVDVVMHDGTLEFRLEDASRSPPGPPLTGHVHDVPLHLARAVPLPSSPIHRPERHPRHQPHRPKVVVEEGDILIGVGTEARSKRWHASPARSARRARGGQPGVRAAGAGRRRGRGCPRGRRPPSRRRLVGRPALFEHEDTGQVIGDAQDGVGEHEGVVASDHAGGDARPSRGAGRRPRPAPRPDG